MGERDGRLDLDPAAGDGLDVEAEGDAQVAAEAGEVTGGFTKEEILRKPEANPREEGGMFARLEGLLRALL